MSWWNVAAGCRGRRMLGADGGAGGGTGAEGQGGEGAGENKGDGGGKPSDDKGGGEDVSGLKSALEKERAAAKELKARLRELQEVAGKAGESEKQLAELKARLGEYEFREKRESALEAAIAAATKDGKVSVDREKAAKLAAKLGNAESLAADVTEIVGLLAAPVSQERKPVIKGQPARQDEDLSKVDPKDWARLRREDPEGYKQMIAARRQGDRFRVGV